ncbi:hypothetical protein DN407_31365 (plasmid) [Bacillus sp. JAS24-2]|uniref:hypothetical protein n=1 Tax=Bacillus sp. JAS24-2 TaxID=2217832 RepID=UPI0011ED634C|nr:hypothetical protein [Bacillus sp. JAS24-2]QEL82898.1 hypothetical protein DN407_31365 [Bacillus sp. JAS24-2]
MLPLLRKKQLILTNLEEEVNNTLKNENKVVKEAEGADILFLSDVDITEEQLLDMKLEMIILKICH